MKIALIALVLLLCGCTRSTSLYDGYIVVKLDDITVQEANRAGKYIRQVFPNARITITKVPTLTTQL